MELGAVVLPVDDVDAAEAFYRAVGFQEVLDYSSGPGAGAGRGCDAPRSGEQGDLANQVNVGKSNQVNFGAFRGSYMDPRATLSAHRTTRCSGGGVLKSYRW
jgi:catechol 2,3-dioxygenase-like lactoylglutathione lyase family enzyme